MLLLQLQLLLSLITLALSDHLCYDTFGNSCSCGPGCDQCSPHPFDQSTPQYHVRDLSCGENDPNFPFFDAKHNLYHLMYQDHLSEYQGGDGQGPDIGHAVSSDLVTWAHLPVSVWNDQPYDSVAIYTGSATIVNGIPTLVYPGLCTKHNWTSCDTGTLLAVAVPADHDGDPLLTNWTKPSYNPIVNNTQRDPSTAWQTAAGEFRLTNYEGKIYSSPDFVNWSAASNGAVIFPVAECPDFFKVPTPCAGNGCTSSSLTNDIEPTHVHKQSSSGQDWYTLGTYTEDSVGSTGTWTPLSTVPTLQALDYSAYGQGMHFYASKSFYDSKNNRQIYWGWALVPPQSTQTLPRVTNYHKGLNILTFNPLPELSLLRASPPLFSASTLSITNQSFWLGDWASVGAGNQSELGATFLFPTSGPPIEFGLSVLNGNVGKPINVSTRIVFTYDPASFSLKASIGGSNAPPTNLSYYMPGIDLPGGDYNVTNVNYSDPKICQAQCTADGAKCQAYTYGTFFESLLSLHISNLLLLLIYFSSSLIVSLNPPLPSPVPRLCRPPPLSLPSPAPRCRPPPLPSPPPLFPPPSLRPPPLFSISFHHSSPSSLFTPSFLLLFPSLIVTLPPSLPPPFLHSRSSSACWLVLSQGNCTSS